MDDYSGSRKGLIIVLCALFVIIAALIISIFLFLNKKPLDDKGVGSQSSTVSQSGTADTNAGKTLYIYKEVISGNLYAIDEDRYRPEDYIQVGEYTSNSSCQYFCSFKDELLIFDKSYRLYNYKTKALRTLALGNEIYGLIETVDDGSTLYGFRVNKNGKEAFFSYEKNKFVTGFDYSFIYSYPADLKRDHVYGCIDLEDSATSNVLDINTGKTVFSFPGKLTTCGNDKGLYYSVYQAQVSSIYNSEYKLLLRVNDVPECKVTKDGSLLIADPPYTKFSIYNKDGDLLFQSKEYQSAHLLTEEYAGVIDGGSLCLIDTSEKRLATFTAWNDQMEFHYMISGYFDGTKEGKKTGIYVVMEDKTISEGTEGRGKEYYYVPETGETGVYLLTEIGGYAKPVLYLYPAKKETVTVRFEKPNLLTTTYPKFRNAWTVTASPNGDLYDQNGKYYYALYWEEKGSSPVNFDTGFYVTKENASSFLEEKLTAIGLSPRERNEFIMYWLPVLEKNEQNLVYFELTNERQSYNKLLISPAPDSLLRIAIHVKKVDKPVFIKEQKLEKFVRKGFTAVEWGGVIHS